VYLHHILVKHTECADATTWKKMPIIRTRDDARQKIQNIRDDIKAGNRTFEELARAESDCVTSHDAGGNIGWLRRGIMPPKFDKVAFALEIGDISGPVDTKLGWHLIWRRG
jgi:NIMA-interacting peptidyl-prolyl cis-trans isomerase 1